MELERHNTKELHGAADLWAHHTQGYLPGVDGTRAGAGGGVTPMHKALVLEPNLREGSRLSGCQGERHRVGVGIITTPQLSATLLGVLARERWGRLSMAAAWSAQPS